MSATTIHGLDPQSHLPIALQVEAGLITCVEQRKHDCELFLSPGFIDLQVNGYAGYDLNTAELAPDAVRALVYALLAEGVTCFAPTLITASENQLCSSLADIAQARRLDQTVAACIPFVHVEGCHISPLDGFRGAHPVEFVRPPSEAEFDRWQRACDGIVGMVTLSPHFDEADEYISALVHRGVHVAIGHTHASAAAIQRAVNAGARLSTHLGNGIAEQIPRHHNAIWPQLADVRLSATFIADGHHLPPCVLKAMFRAKGVDRSILVSDSVALAGMPPGIYTTPVGGRVELHPDGRLCVFGSELLAGSTASLAQCIGAAVRLTDIPLHQALAMATCHPGAFTAGRGQLTAGSRADIVRFRWNKEVVIEDVWLAGEQVFARGADKRKVALRG